MRVVINARLTAVGTQQNLNGGLYSHHAEKADLPEMRDNDTITRKVRANGNKVCPGKEWRLYTQ